MLTPAPVPGRRLPGLLVLVVLAALLTAPRAAAEPGWPQEAGWPLAGVPVVVRGFSPPAERWGAGHRGVDLSAPVGAEVLAAADGVVLFAGQVAGRPVLTIGHGPLRTTYEPVRATVSVGTRVRAGQVVGRLQRGHCGTPSEACLHWGLLRGEEYLDPTLLPHDDRSAATLRLLPSGSDARARAAARTRAAAVAAGTAPAGRPGAHGFVAPVAGPVTSPFGPRLHPVLGVVRLHDGTDFGVPCGTGMRAARGGTVVERVSHPAYGERLVVDHGRVGGHRFRTSYNHALGYSVGVGAEVTRGQVVGRVGSTGYSTGCHLHLMMWVDGVLVDPQEWL
ncbi:M23 family metallopeptidase [Auraticoccus monumenti]|uniref:Peptidase family M23 n=1 Tax=Auraticoccus monumenti TaxID=675864 RepID=A0A1G7DCQ9_9ACTN|nr:M23 family metallopeptidase [Auraticoccus monumenti]SDE48760.1 Peptidase family M23 [Auraticoccus monumenti]